MSGSPAAGAEFSIPEIFDPFFLEVLHKHWNDSHFALGVEIIDAQHLWLVALVSKMEILQQAKQGGALSGKMAAYARELVRFLRIHLELEERVMKAGEIPRNEEVALEHADFLSRLQAAFSLDTSGEMQNAESFVSLIKLWLDRHIKKDDPQWKVYLSKHHFNPTDFVKAVILDIGEEYESTHMMLYRQLLVAQEVIPGIRKAILDDIFQLWKRFDVRTNIPLIDMQHLWLFKMVVEMESMLHVSFAERRTHLERVLADLLAYVEVHFQSEEWLMAKLGYPEEKNHHRLHDDFRRTVQKLKQDYDAGNHHSLSSLVTLLRQWLLTHIVIEDSKFARACAADPQNTINASRLLIREKEIPVLRDQTLIYTYITARMRASGG
ncbi:MAG: bacteriohemerythrin [Spirochaetota bacterium]